MIKMLAIAAIAATAIVPAARADYFDDQLAKAERRVETAAANLQKWRACVADKATCKADQQSRAEAAAKRAADKAAAIMAVASE